MGLKRILGLKQKVEEARQKNEASINRMENEKQERIELDRKLSVIEVDLENMARGRKV